MGLVSLACREYRPRAMVCFRRPPCLGTGTGWSVFPFLRASGTWTSRYFKAQDPIQNEKDVFNLNNPRKPLAKEAKTEHTFKHIRISRSCPPLTTNVNSPKPQSLRQVCFALCQKTDFPSGQHLTFLLSLRSSFRKERKSIGKAVLQLFKRKKEKKINGDLQHIYSQPIPLLYHDILSLLAQSPSLHSASARTTTVPALTLTPEAFAPFGKVVQAYSDLHAVPSPRTTRITGSANQGTAVKFHKLALLESSYPAQSGATTGLSVYRCKPIELEEGGIWTVKLLERHPDSEERLKAARVKHLEMKAQRQPGLAIR